MWVAATGALAAVFAPALEKGHQLILELLMCDQKEIPRSSLVGGTQLINWLIDY